MLALVRTLSAVALTALCGCGDPPPPEPTLTREGAAREAHAGERALLVAPTLDGVAATAAAEGDPGVAAERRASAVSDVPEGYVVVEVVDVNGEPVSGIRVNGVDGKPRRPRFALGSTTGPDGRASLPPARKRPLYAAELCGGLAAFSTPDAPERIELPAYGTLVIDPREFGERVACTLTPRGADMSNGRFAIEVGERHRLERVPTGVSFLITLRGEGRAIEETVAGPTVQGQTVVWAPKAVRPLLSGRVVDEAGAAVEGALVRLLRRHSHLPWFQLVGDDLRVQAPSDGVLATCKSDANGHFELFAFGLGEVGADACYVDAASLVRRASARSAIAAFGQSDILLALEPHGSIEVIAGECFAPLRSTFVVVVRHMDGLRASVHRPLLPPPSPIELPPGHYAVDINSVSAMGTTRVLTIEGIEVRAGAPCSDPRITPLEFPLRRVVLLDENDAPVQAPTILRCFFGEAGWAGIAAPLSQDGVASWIDFPELDRVVVEAFGFTPYDVTDAKYGAIVRLSSAPMVRFVAPPGERPPSGYSLRLEGLGPNAATDYLRRENDVFVGPVEPGMEYRAVLMIPSVWDGPSFAEDWDEITFVAKEGTQVIELRRR